MAKLAHIMVANIAKEIAGTYYSEAARDDVFYKTWPKERVFIAKNWQHFVPFARQALAQMLGDSKWPESAKELMFEALVLDKSLPQGNDTTVRPAHVTH